MLLFVARSVTLLICNAIKRMKSNVKGRNHIVTKLKVTEEYRLSVTSKVTETNNRLVRNSESEADTTSFQNRHNNNKEDMVDNERQTETKTNSRPSQQCWWTAKCV